MAETTVYFYGPVTSSQDTTTKLTSDLFFSQLQSTSGYILIDNRNIIWEEDFVNQINQSDTAFLFCAINFVPSDIV